MPPHRRPLPKPCVRVQQPEHPTNNSRVVCEGQSHNSFVRSSGSESSGKQQSTLNLNSGTTENVLGSFNSDSFVSGTNQSALYSRENSENNSISDISNDTSVADSPNVVITRPQRQRKPPDRYGEWVLPISATVNSLLKKNRNSIGSIGFGRQRGMAYGFICILTVTKTLLLSYMYFCSKNRCQM